VILHKNVFFKNLLLCGTEGVCHKINKKGRKGRWRGGEGVSKMSSDPLNSNLEGTINSLKGYRK
jgi:hypothetical protein